MRGQVSTTALDKLYPEHLRTLMQRTDRSLAAAAESAAAEAAESAAGAAAGGGVVSVVGAGASVLLPQALSTSAATKALKASLVFIYRYPGNI